MQKKDLSKKLTFDPLGLTKPPSENGLFSTTTQTSTQAFIPKSNSYVAPVPPSTTSTVSPTKSSKVGSTSLSNSIKTTFTDANSAIRDFLLSPSTSTSPNPFDRQSTSPNPFSNAPSTSINPFIKKESKTPIAQPEAPKNSALDLLTSLPSQFKKDSPLRSGFQEGMLSLSSAFNRFNQSFYEFFGDTRNAAISEKAANKDAELYKALTQSGVEVQDDRKFTEKLKDPNYFYKSLGQNIPSMLGALGISIPLATVGAPVAVATGAALTFGGSQAYGNSLNQAKDFGVDDEQAKKIATFSAIGNGILESIPAGRLLSKLKGPAMNEIKQAFVKNVTDKLVSVFKQGVTEGTTESLQTVYDNALQKTYNENQDLFAGLKESFVFGGILGGGTDLAVDTIAGAKNLQEKAATLPNQQGGFLKVSKGFDKPAEVINIEEEAKKYSTPEEFIQAVGDPVYHGTNAEFTDFNADKIGLRDSGWFGKGFYFTQSKSEAGYYGQNIMPRYLDLQKPFDFSAYEHPDFKGYSFADGYNLSKLAEVVPDINTDMKVDIMDEQPTESNGYTRSFKQISFGEYDARVKEEALGAKAERYEGDNNTQEYTYTDTRGDTKFVRFGNASKPIPKEVLDYALFNEKYKVDTNTGNLYGVEKAIADKMGVKFTEKLKELGYDGAIQSPYGDEYVSFYPEKIKTKAQLEQIWKNAKASEIKDAIEFRDKKLNDYKPGKPLPEFKGFTDLSTKTLEKLAGRRIVSNQFIADLIKSPDIKKAERDIIQKVLDTYADQPNIPVKEFADKVKLELLPLSYFNSLTDGSPRYEFVHLPESVKGDVENYHEKIYESPIKTGAGDIHFGGNPMGDEGYSIENYFAHTRVDETSDGFTRRVLEMQSDLFQRGRLETSTRIDSASRVKELNNKELSNPELDVDRRNFLLQHNEELDQMLQEDSKLIPYENIWHERIIREEIKQAAKDGKSILQFPTGETAMKVEGLGGQELRWFIFDDGSTHNSGALNKDGISVGTIVSGNPNATNNQRWIITSVLGEGKFKAIQTNKISVTAINMLKSGKDMYDVPSPDSSNISNYAETFDISGNVDTKSPIYRFYENTVAKYIKNNYGAVRVTDPQGIEWFEVTVSKSAQRKPVVAYKKYIFSKLQGPKILTTEAETIIKEVLENDKIKVAFKDDLIDGVATGEYSEVEDAVAGIVKPMITLYKEGEFTSATTALHEAGHYMFNRLLTDKERKMALDIARKEMTVVDKAKYFAAGYSKDERLEEYIVDKYAAAKASEKGYKGNWAKVFELIDSVLKKIVNAFESIIQRHRDIVAKRGGNRGIVNFFEPLDVNTLKTVSETKIPDAIADTLESKFTALSRRTIEMFSKRLAKLKNTDDIQGLAGVMAKMDQEIKETAVVRGYTRESLPRGGSKTPITPTSDGRVEIPPSIGELLTTKEKASYVDTVSKLQNLVNAQEAYDGISQKEKVALASIEYDAIWSKINTRSIIQFEELAVEKSILEEVIAQNNAKKLLKYFGPNDPKNVELYDLFTQAKGTNKKIRIVDRYLEELGFIDDQGNGDFEAAQRGIESYLDMRDRFRDIKVEMRKLRPQVEAARILKKELDGVPVMQDIPTISAIDSLSDRYDITDTYKDIAGIEKEALDHFRIFEKFFGKKFKIVKEAIIDPFDLSKGEMVDDIDRLATMIEKNVTDKYNITRGSKDAQRVRQYGEGKMSRQDLVNEVGETRANELIAADSFFRGFFDDLLNESNAILAEIYPNNPEKLIPKHKNYYRHMRDKNSLGDALTAIKGLFETPGGITPSLAGLSERTQPRAKWLAYAQKRLGEATNTDAIEGTLDYISAFAYLKHISPHISKFRYLRRRLADNAPTPGDTSELKIGKEPGINNFLVFLDSYANRLAGKSHTIDRWVSDTIPGGRNTLTAVSMANNRVKANTIMGKFGSFIAQMANVPLGIASAKQYSIPGMRRSLASIFHENGPIKESSFIKERNLQSLTQRFKVEWHTHPIQRTIDEGKNAMAWLLQAGDAIGTNFIWNSHYEKALAENMEDPIRYADNITRKLVAGRGIGEVPLGQESKVFQIVAPFQIEVGNLMWAIRDMVKEKDMAGLALLFIANYLFNEFSEETRGSRVTYDPINALIEGIVMFSEEDDKWRGTIKFTGRQVGEILSNVPLGQTFAGQIPEAAVEYVTNILTDTPMSKRDLFGQGDPGRFGSGFLIWKTFEDPIFRFLLPYGGLQAKTTMEGIQSYIDGEVRDKEGKLNFTMDKNFVNLFKAVLFGKNAVSEAREYFDEREDLFRILDAQQIKRDDFAAAAEEKYQEVKEIKAEKGSEGAKAALKQIAVENPKLASAVIEIAKMEAKGFDGVDRLIKQLGVDNGERAKFIVEKLKDFESPTDKKEYLKELATKGLLSEKVIEQIGYLASKSKK